MYPTQQKRASACLRSRVMISCLCLSLLSATIGSCKKESITTEDGLSIETETALAGKKPANSHLLQNSNFPNGILKFNTKAEVDAFLLKESETTGDSSSVYGFTSFRSIAKAQLEKERKRSLISDLGTEEIVTDTTDFLTDVNIALAENEELQSMLNQDLQVIYADSLYQFTRIGMLKVDTANIPSFLAYINQYRINIQMDSTFTAFPNETAASDGSHNVAGIFRRDLLPIEGDPFPCDYGCPGGGGSAPVPPCSVQLPAGFQYGLNTTNTNFNKTAIVNFGDRRFVFKAQNDNFIFYKSIGIKAKLQRRKKFLGVRYWGPSYADEIIVGRDNMHIKTNYVFPYPYQFSNISRPVVAGFATANVGGDILNYMNIRININTPFGAISNSNLASLLNGTFNSVLGGVYTNGFIAIENNIINSLDPSYLPTQQNYIKKIEYLDNLHRLRFIEGKKELARGYSHKKEWVFDWNAGFAYGGAPDPTYEYEMTGSSFYARTRVGCSWYGLRIVVQ